MTTAPTDSDFTLTADAVGIGSTALFGIGGHQSQLPPAMNKFHKGNGQDGKHYWLTPWDEPAIAQLVADYGPFDFDPCPCPKPDDFDGLTCEWGANSYVNPPFGSIMHEGKKKGPTAWARKAIAEAAKGKRVTLVYPIDKWVLMLLAAGARVENLGDVRWLATEDGSAGKGTGRHIACFVLGSPEQDAALLTREAALVAERDALRDVAAAYEVARQEIFDHCLSNGVFNAWGKAMDCTSLNDAHMLARNSDGGTRAIAAERDALAAEVVALRENAAAERNRGIMDAQGLLHEVSSKHRSAAATAYAQELLNAMMQKYAETQAAARAPATIGGDAT